VSTVDANRSHNWFVRAAAVIGDLSSPFYAEERQRDVWNEASAVALQVLIWLHLLTATAVVWLVGADSLPYVYALIAMIGVAGWVAILYSASLGVHVEKKTGTSRRRLVPVLVLALALAAGMVRAQVGDFSVDGWSTVAGMATGVGLAVGVLVAVARLSRNRTQGDEQE
jgi:hypothetical protein